MIGVGYNDISINLKSEVKISEFQKTFKIEYRDKLIFPKEDITNNNLILEFNFVDTDDNIINKKVEMALVSIQNDKSTK